MKKRVNNYNISVVVAIVITMCMSFGPFRTVALASDTTVKKDKQCIKNSLEGSVIGAGVGSILLCGGGTVGAAFFAAPTGGLSFAAASLFCASGAVSGATIGGLSAGIASCND